ncbi:mite allergen Der f 3-like [Cloeon dipterum]|uniref:mite allergen Der f 3-like n=1 Tax=Cloeon dipterum TaxID=197152 RepID=UPI00322043D9
MSWTVIGALILLSSQAFAEDLEGRFTGGADVQFVPGYVATILPLGLEINNTEFCGGVLINSSLILTVASCMFGANAAIISSGFRTDNLVAEIATGQISYMTQIYYHPDFMRNTHVNDIAIIRVYPPFNITSTVFPISLPKGSNVRGDAIGKNWQLTWFSFGNYNETNMPDTMQSVEFTYLPTKNCTNIYAKKPYWYHLQKSLFCMAPSQTVGICPGDAGSPVIAVDKKTNKPFLVGLASKDTDDRCPVTPNAANKHTPDLFVRIDPFFKWIQSMGGPKSQ